jgi:hypothetical protein
MPDAAEECLVKKTVRENHPQGRHERYAEVFDLQPKNDRAQIGGIYFYRIRRGIERVREHHEGEGKGAGGSSTLDENI